MSSCKEKSLKLNMNVETCIENSIFLYMTQMKLESNGHTKF